jgi:hypothetical protein
MSDKQKDDLITRSTWTQIRKFYNQFSSHNKELTDSKLLDVDATTLRKDLESLVITWRNINYSPVFEQALNESIKYTPALSSDLNIQIFIDVSTSMYRHQYIDKALWLARYMATDKTTITTFNTEIEETITKEQLFSTSIRTLFSVGGSTRVTAALEAIQPETDLTIILSDNETWVENQTSTSVKEVYADLREQGKIKGKVVFWDLEFKPCVPVSDDNTLNMSGLNTQLINAVIRFASDSTSLVDTIKNIKIR